MDDSRQYGQQDFNLPHDVVSLPSGGLFYLNKKKSVKVGYLTAQDENVILSTDSNDNIVHTLLGNKIYEPDLRPHQLLEGDAEAILIFLRNTSFGPDYRFTLRDPKTKKEFEQTIRLDELNIKPSQHTPNEEGLFTFNLPKSNSTVECKLLNLGDMEDLKKMENSYPTGMVVPIVTNKLIKQIVSVNGQRDNETISKFVNSLPIMDSKFIRNTLLECEPRLDLDQTVIAPSGEQVKVKITFGVEFFRPFF
jgi:hypothetical protein